MEPSHDLDARYTRNAQNQDTALLEMRLEIDDEDLVGELGTESRCRVTTGTGSVEESTQVIEHQVVSCNSSDAWSPRSDCRPTRSSWRF